MKDNEFKQPSNIWYEEFMKTNKTRILDPDGWNRADYRYSFYEEEVTYLEFINRLMMSTCSYVVEEWLNGNVPGNDKLN